MNPSLTSWAMFSVQHRNCVDEPVFDQLGDVFDILRTFESVADDVAVFVDDAAVVECVDDVDVVGRRGFEMDVVLHRLFQYERKMARLGAITIVVRSFIVDFCHRYIEHTLRSIDLR